MKHLKSLSNQDLLSKTHALAADERKLNVEILHHLREIDTRKLYAERHSSLHEYMVKDLHYSDGAAHRRIQAARLLRDLPEAEAKLKTGAITLTTASQLQNFFRAEKKLGTTYAAAEKRELLAQLEDKTSRQTEGLLAAISPQAIPRERERALNETETSVTFVVPARLTEKLARVRGLLAHRNASPSYAELFEILADIALEKLDPSLRSRRARCAPIKLERTSVQPSLNPAPYAHPSPSPRSTHFPRYIPAELRRMTWTRAGGRCEFNDQSGRRCTSKYALEVDHIRPIGLGGNAASENLQLLCRSHNAYKNRGDYGFVWRQAGKEKRSALKCRRAP